MLELLQPTNNKRRKPILDGCVLYLDGRYGGNDPATQTWYDLSGNGNDGALTNFAYNHIFSGWTGQGLQFDGTDDYVDCGKAVVPTGDFTITALCDVKSFASGFRIILGQYLVNDTGRFWFGFDRTNFGYRIGADSQTIPVQTGIRYLSMTKQGATVKLYVNGELKSTSTVANEVLQINAVVGAYDVTNGYFDGIIHNVFVYNRALSDREITQNYLATKCIMPLKHVDGAVLDLRGREGTNTPATTVWQDASGHGNNAELKNVAFTVGDGWTGDALEFDGVDSYCDCGNRASLTPNYITIDFSLTLYGLENNSGIFSKGGSSNRIYWMWIYDGNYRLKIGSGDIFSPNITPIIGERHHFTLTYDGSSVKVYVDGVLDTEMPQQTGVLVYDEIPLKLGFLTGAINGKYGHFQMYSFRIYPKALSEAEVLQNYLATVNRHLFDYSKE